MWLWQTRCVCVEGGSTLCGGGGGPGVCGEGGGGAANTVVAYQVRVGGTSCGSGGGGGPGVCVGGGELDGAGQHAGSIACGLHLVWHQCLWLLY